MESLKSDKPEVDIKAGIDNIIHEVGRFVETLNREDLQELKDYEFDEDLDVLWLNFGLFVDNLINTKTIKNENLGDLISLYMAVDYLKGLGAYAASYNYIGKGVIPEHTDEELCSEVVSVRMFIPLTDTNAEFSGLLLDKDSDPIEVCNMKIPKEGVCFTPNAPHSLNQLDDNGHYIIVDIVRRDASEEDLIEYKQYAVASYS